MHQIDYTKGMQIVTHRVLNSLHLNGLGKVQDYFTYGAIPSPNYSSNYSSYHRKRS